MRKRRASDPVENHERWLVSYADFITLLFAFFVVMYANSQVNQAKAEKISNSVRRAMEDGRVSTVFAKLLGNAPEKRHPETPPKEEGAETSVEPSKIVELQPSVQLLRESLREEIELGRMDVKLEKRGLIISLREATFFPSGGDILEPNAYPALEKVAAAISRVPNPIRLEGHTDSRPIRTSRFRSNWELSAARGIAMLEVLQDRFNIPRERMAIAGFAETSPVAENDSEGGMARNRRVDIVILNEVGMQSQPEQSKQLMQK